MNSYERVMTALSHKEADRVPVFLFFTFYGAKELGVSIEEYFSKAENVASGQKRLLRKFGHDCVYAFFYAALEAVAFGQEVEFYDDGPPNAGTPVLKNRDDIFTLKVPDPFKNKALAEAIKATELLAAEYKKKVPVISAVVGPYSLPVMLMGMNNWLEIIVSGDTEAITAMTAKTSAFCLEWGNALFRAGADAIGFFEPFATTTMVRREEFIKYIYNYDKQLISRFNGPVAFCGAGGRMEPIMDKICETGAAACALSVDDNLERIKNDFGGKINIIGNLNNISMIDWTYDEAKKEAKKCLENAKEGGGYILADQHGEISWPVTEDALRGIVDAAIEFGKYA
ncbi:MAG: uroporphyrinogen decarboxylase family protein [Candidatus Omnitrophota bacterium]